MRQRGSLTQSSNDTTRSPTDSLFKDKSMPTGYTADLTKETTFKEFALRCARGMGALILMRDDPMDAPIPDEFQADNYYVEALEDAQSDLSRVGEMTVDDAAEELKRHNKKQEELRADLLEKSVSQREIYDRMVQLVESWKAPTANHEGMKKFMLEQLRGS